MCGDGANDCAALKAAHVGISLSEAEASVAAPFTSQVANITCVPSVIKEGRCALVTSFGVFRYMALYSMVQFITVLILYTLQTNLGDFQFFYIDLFITAVVAVFMGQTRPYEKLVAKRPSASLISGPNMVSLFLQIFLSMGIQCGVIFFLSSKPWYVPLHPSNPKQEIIKCWETTSLFCVSSFQYLVLAVIFSKGRPYRQPFYTNIFFTLSVIILATVTILVTLYPGQGLANFLQLMFDPLNPTKHLDYRLSLLVWVGFNILLCILIEKAIVERRWLKKIVHFFIRKRIPKNKFRVIQMEMDQDGWPYVSPMNCR
jgi:magnesium-transporting ATPase (P-type)